MPAKKSNKVKQLTPLEDIDTSVLSLQLLQEFCERVGSEIETVETESRELEIERNKLKMLADVANHQLKSEKSRLRWTENDLEREKEQFILNLLQLNNNVRNVQIESAKECHGKIEETFMKLQSITKSSVESCNELIQDMRELNYALRHIEVEQLNSVTKLNIEQDENRAKLLQKDDDVRQVSMVHQKIRRREMVKDIVDKCNKEMVRLATYKDKVIKQAMTKNDKDTLHTRHYYEKILDVNRTVLEDLHDKYKAMKGNLTTYKRQITTLKADVSQAEKDIEANREQRKIINIQMMDSECKKEEIIAVRRKYATRKERTMERKADNMILDEILAISEKEIEQNWKPAEEEILSIKLRVVEQITLLEQLLNRLRDHVTTLDQMIDFAQAKREYAGRRMSCEQSTQVALQLLTDEAERELMELRRSSLMHHLSAE